MSGCMRDLVKVVARSSTAFRSTAADRDVFVIEFAFTIERWRGREKIAIEIQGCGHAEYCDISFLADIQFSGLKRRRRRAPTALIEMEHDMPIYLLPLSLFTATNATSRVCSPGIYTNKQQRSSSGRVGPRGRHRPGGGVYSRA